MDRLAKGVGSWFGCGRAPFAPGTVGSLGALPLYWVVRRLAAPSYWGIWGALVGAGIWAAARLASQQGESDPSEVVIDEVIGVLLSLGLVRGRGVLAAAAAFSLFRYLDITKPGPIRRAEQVGPPGVSILLDDVVAGLGAGLLARATSKVIDFSCARRACSGG